MKAASVATALLLSFSIFACAPSEVPKEKVPDLSVDEFKEAAGSLANCVDCPDQEASRKYFESEKGKDLTRRRLARLFSDRGIRIMDGASRVESFRAVDSSASINAGEESGRVEEFRLLKKGKPGDADFAKRLAGFLRDGKLYFDNPGCLPTPTLAYRFWAGKESVTVVLAMECYHLDVFVQDENGYVAHRAGSYLSDHFGKSDPLPALAKEAFPDDPEIAKFQPKVPVKP